MPARVGHTDSAGRGESTVETIFTAGGAGEVEGLEETFFLAKGKERPLFFGETVTHFSARGVDMGFWFKHGSLSG